MPQTPDLVGKTFGRLLVIERKGSSKFGKALWLCKCLNDNNMIIVETGKLTTGHTKSCGCLKIEKIIKRNTENSKYNGDSYTRIYTIWYGMIRRCETNNCESSYLYNGKGISVCDEWHNYFAFKDWALNNGYSDLLSIDRINNNGNYEPSNCKWSTNIEQANNRSDNVYLYIDGEEKTIAQWARIKNMTSYQIFKQFGNKLNE